MLRKISRARSLQAFVTLFALVCCLSFAQSRPTMYIIGDSTVRNSTGHGGPGLWGWGTFIGDLFDSTKLAVSNQAMAGRSTRTFLSEGRWDRVLISLKPGDFVIMQFGHNDGSVPDTSRTGYRGTLKGTSEETKELTYADGRKETVHTYGWYLRKFVTDAKAKGAIPIICSMIPRNEFREGRVIRASENFGRWTAEVATAEKVYFIDLNKITADKYDAMGAEKVKAFFPGDHTHTNEEGARLNAASIIEGIKDIKDLPLNRYLR